VSAKCHGGGAAVARRRGRGVAGGLLALLLLATLAGCARFRPAPAPAVDPDAVAAFEYWQLAARIAVQRADKGFSADLDWRQHGLAYELKVMAPLNGGTFALRGDAGGVELLTPKGERYTAADPVSLMERHLGWSIALDGARYWVRGLPRPDSPAAQAVRDEAGRLTDFAQDGWRISVLEYREAAGLALPRRLFLASGDLAVKLVAKEWRPLAP